MGRETGIAWCHHTFNCWWGCTKVDPCCDNCYAEAWDRRYGGDHWGEGVPRRIFGDKHWNEPLKWNLDAAAAGERRRTFCASMADVFDKDAPDGQRERLWRLIRATPHLDWQILTKRANLIEQYLPADWGDGYPNVWLGVSVGTLKGRWRIKYLREIPAAVRFISYEPALEAPEFDGYLDGIAWLICGEESGAAVERPRIAMPEEWARMARDQCKRVGISFFYKQKIEGAKKVSLPVLDGRQWAEFPR